MTSRNEYVIDMTGTTPEKMRFKLNGPAGGALVKILYNEALLIEVKADGKVKNTTPWDKGEGRPKALTKNKGCGENRFVSIENFVEFYITAKCEIYLKPKNAIRGMVRLDWTLEEFYSDGGTSRFVDRLASVLGIHKSRVKIVAVYEGSVIVEFFVEALNASDDNASSTATQQELDDLTRTMVRLLSSGAANLGAPVLGFEGDGILLYGDPIPKTINDRFIAPNSVITQDDIWESLRKAEEILQKQREEALENGQIFDFDGQITT